MRIKQVSNIWSQVDFESIPVLRDFLSYQEITWGFYGGKRHPSFRKRTFVGVKNGFFFSGFLPLIEEEFPEVEILYKNTEPEEFEQFSIIGGKELRDYQKNLLDIALTNKRGVLKAPTGSGKTLIEAAIIQTLERKSLLVVHTKTLLSQIKTELENILNEHIGIVGDGQEDWDRVTVGMVQSLSKIPKRMLFQQNFDCVIIDETHHAVAATYQYILSAIDAEYRFGLSATPKDFEDEKGEYLKVIGVLGPIIGSVDYEEIKDVLAIPDVRILEHDGNDGLDHFSWQPAYEYGIEVNTKRNTVIAQFCSDEWAKSNMKAGILILVKTIAHGRALQVLIPYAEFIEGKDDIKTRDKAKEALKGGKIVIATAVFGEGIDIPSLDFCINAGAGLSRIQTIQRAGRVLRKTEGKTVGVIVDFMDTGNRFLARHSRERIKLYKQLGWLK